MKTNEYSKFNFLKENRAISERNVEEIKLSIKEHGIIPGRPILVDPDFNIVDGQHRFLAIKQMHLPITYEIVEGDIIQKTMALNANQRPWQMIDYIKSYAEQGIDFYRKILKFEEKYDFGITNVLYLCIGLNWKTQDIKKGRPFEIYEHAEGIANYLDTFEHVSYRKTKSFVWAIINLYKKSTEQQREIINNNILKIPHFQNPTDYKIAFENILNKNKKNNFVKL